MDPKQKNRFYLLWTLSIFLCTALAVFLLFYASFTEPKEPKPETPATGQSESFENYS